jgi:glycolate oxidase
MAENPYAYNKVTPDVVKRLKAILGDRFVYTDEEKMENYSHDETDKKVYAKRPEAVVLPGTPEEISKVVILANQEKIPITPRGAGSGLSGGAIPAYGGIVLSVERLNRLIEIDKANLVGVVEAGMVTNEFAQAVQNEGLFFAGYPMSLQTCMIGGNIAENAGGGKAVKYGVTGRYVIGLEFVTPLGKIVRLGGKNVKDVSAYDLKSLIVGSEGTLGIVTKAVIKLIGLPTAKADLLVLFKTAQDAIDVVPVILGKGLTPTSIEFMDRNAASESCKYLNESLPYGDAGAMLLIELDGNDPDQVERDLIGIGKFCEERKAIEVYVAEDKNNIERIWNVRRNIAEAFNLSPYQCVEDIVVPISNIPRMLPALEEMSRKHNIIIPCYGHAGDGNLHVTLVKAPDMDAADWPQAEHACLEELYAVTDSLGGKISGEHGIGSKRLPFLKKLINPDELELMRAIKRAWDPNNIMNPGKIFEV